MKHIDLKIINFLQKIARLINTYIHHSLGSIGNTKAAIYRDDRIQVC